MTIAQLNAERLTDASRRLAAALAASAVSSKGPRLAPKGRTLYVVLGKRG